MFHYSELKNNILSLRNFIISFLCFSFIVNFILFYKQISFIFLGIGTSFFILILYFKWNNLKNEFINLSSGIYYVGNIVIIYIYTILRILYHPSFNINFERLRFKIILIFFIFNIFFYYKRFKLKINFNNKKLLFFILFSYLIYLSNLNFLSSPDTDPAKYTVYSLYFEKDFDLNEFYEKPLIDKEKNPDFIPPKNSLWGIRTDPITKKVYWINPSVMLPINGQIYGHFPLGPSLYQTIFVLLLKSFQFPVLNKERLFSNIQGANIHKVFYDINFKIGEPYQLERISSAIIACLILIAFYMLLNQLKIDNYLFYLFLYGYATFLFTIESQALWQHGFIELFSILGIIFIHKYLHHKKKKYLIAISILLTLNLYFRPTSLFISLLICIYFIILSYKKLKYIPIFRWEFIISFLIINIFFIFINYSIYYHPGGGYFVALSDPLHEGIKFDVKGYLTRLYYLLFSPSRGLIFFFPYFIFIFYSFKDNKQTLLKVISISIIIIYHLFYAYFTIWTAGFSYGNRFFSELTPFFLILLIYTYEYLYSYLKKLFYFFIWISVLIQIHGAYLYEHTSWSCKAGYNEEKLVKSWEHLQQLFFIEQIKPLFKKEIYYKPEESCLLNYNKEEEKYYIKIEQSNKNNLFFVSNLYLPTKSCLTFYFNKITLMPTLNFTFNNIVIQNSLKEEINIELTTPKIKKVLINISTNAKNSFVFEGYKIHKGNCKNESIKLNL